MVSTLTNPFQLLKEEIRDTFGDVPFPSYRGLRAAQAIDDWVSDPEILQNITGTKDIKAKWWEIPYDELNKYLIADSYLDASGIEFYLPAILTMALEEQNQLNLDRALSILDPNPGNSMDQGLNDYFCARFSKINVKKREVCIKFMKLIKPLLNEENCYSQKDVDLILRDKFWIAT